MKVGAFALTNTVLGAATAWPAPGTGTLGTHFGTHANRYDDLTFRAVSADSSTDLVNWDHSGDILTNSSITELNKCNIERPKVIYNAATSKFVLWAHWENGVDYKEARTMLPPSRISSRDMTTYVDTDGSGYLVSSTRTNADLNIYKLTPDYADIDSLVVTSGMDRATYWTPTSKPTLLQPTLLVLVRAPERRKLRTCFPSASPTTSPWETARHLHGTAPSTNPPTLAAADFSK
ncbi:hypothetical protein BJ742DRAFT_777017 [Cladochytrium replicatum]|nr:hypothetical protein BJ742DRAFT_777017 [Cladochytrium replicatum]